MFTFIPAWFPRVIFYNCVFMGMYVCVGTLGMSVSDIRAARRCLPLLLQ